MKYENIMKWKEAGYSDRVYFGNRIQEWIAARHQDAPAIEMDSSEVLTIIEWEKLGELYATFAVDRGFRIYAKGGYMEFCRRPDDRYDILIYDSFSRHAGAKHIIYNISVDVQQVRRDVDECIHGAIEEGS